MALPLALGAAAARAFGAAQAAWTHRTLARPFAAWLGGGGHARGRLSRNNARLRSRARVGPVAAGVQTLRPAQIREGDAATFARSLAAQCLGRCRAVHESVV